MSTRNERDQARIRCLATAISSMHCELGRIVQAGENPEQLQEYAYANLALGDTGEDLIGLSMEDLVDLLGPITAMEKLISMGVPVEMIVAMALNGMMKEDVDPQMRTDLMLYLEGASQDRVPESDVEA